MFYITDLKNTKPLIRIYFNLSVMENLFKTRTQQLKTAMDEYRKFNNIPAMDLDLWEYEVGIESSTHLTRYYAANSIYVMVSLPKNNHRRIRVRWVNVPAIASRHKKRHLRKHDCLDCILDEFFSLSA